MCFNSLCIVFAYTLHLLVLI
uniref:Uncharacterized protein n=1 Tax=Arundo donax TaxID=35708 RepID=A0A0A9GXZ8_ARUDO